MSQLDPETLTDDELRKQLITSDYLGKEHKEACLNELIFRTREIIYNNLKDAVFTE